MPLSLTQKKPPVIQAPATAAPTPRKSRKPRSRRAVLSSLSPELVLTKPWFISQAGGDALMMEYILFLKSGGMPMASWDDEDDDDTEQPCDPDDPNCPYFDVTEDGIACIPVRGTLIKSDYSFAYSFATSYSAIDRMCASALRRSEVNSILFCSDSPGGDADGMFDTSDYLFSVRDQKPMCAISDNACYSAAYGVCSAVGKLFLTRTAGVGSIGCYMQHLDISKMLADMGIAVTLIRSGDLKVDGNPYEPLSARAEAEWQAETDRLRLMFATTVGRNRAASVDALMDTEAGIAMAEAALPLLADAVGTVDDAFTYLRGKVAEAAGTVDDPQGEAPGSAEAPGERDDPFNRTMKIPFHRVGLTDALPNSKTMYFEDAHGEIIPFDSDGVDGVLKLFKGSDLTVRSQAYGLLSGLKELRSQYPNAVACIRTLERRAAVLPNGKISILSAPYDGSAANLGQFDEIYRPGCFKDGLSRDMVVLFNHAESVAHILGRTSAGTARFYEDAEGLHAEADPPDTVWYSDLKKSMIRGDITGASCAFWIVEQSWEVRNGRRTRIVEKALCHDASIEVEGAYPSAISRVESRPEQASSSVINKRRLDIARRRVV